MEPGYAIATFLHDLFTATWIGGMATLGLVVIPSVKTTLGMTPNGKKLMETIQSRMSKLAYASMLGLILSGLPISLRSTAFQGFFSLGNAFSAALALKHLLVVAMIGVALYRSLVLFRPQASPSPSRTRLSLLLLYVNLGLGMAVLLVSAIAATLLR